MKKPKKNEKWAKGHLVIVAFKIRFSNNVFFKPKIWIKSEDNCLSGLGK